MEYVQTVLGRIAPEDMKITLPHEHILWDHGVVYASGLSDDPEEQAFLHRKICMKDLGKIRYNMHAHRDNVYQDDPVEAAEELSEYKRAGGTTLCDCSCFGTGRNPRAVRQVAKDSGVNIIMATGVYVERSHPEQIRQLSINGLADMFIKELTEGMDDTDIKAGFIGEMGVSADFPQREKDALVAACIAQKETGAAILIHQPGFHIAWEIVDLFEKNGGDLSKTALCHSDAMIGDIDCLDGLAKAGINLTFDQFGLEFLMRIVDNYNVWLPRDYDRIRTVAELLRRGNQNIMLSQDVAFKACYKKYGGWGYSHILENIIPLLLHEGVTQEQIDQMTIENPKKIFTLHD